MIDMKKILRSVIDINGTVKSVDLQKNLWKLSDNALEFIVDEDQHVWEYIVQFAKDHSDVPSMSSVRDHFEKEVKLEVLDRLNEIESVQDFYINSDFENLVRQALREQNERKTSFLLKDAAHILTNGLDVGTGRQKKHYKGFQDSLRYVLENSDKLLMSDSGQVFRSDITGDAAVVHKDFDNTLSNVHNAWGRATGLVDIDNVSRGVKPGELWIHAASTGELKCVQMFSSIFNHSTKKLETVKDMFDRNELPIVTALKNEGAEPTLVTAQTSHLVQNGVRSLYTVKLKSGRELAITDNHPLWNMTDQGNTEWKELKDLSINDWVGIPSIMRVPEPREDFSDAEVKILGYLLGDGYIKGHTIDFAAKDDTIRHDYLKEVLSLGYEEGRKEDIGRNTWCREYISPGIRQEKRILCSGEKDSHISLILEKLNLRDADSRNKFIPGELFGLPDRQIALLLGALWSTDGSCHTGDHDRKDRVSQSKRNDITYASISKELATGVQGLLLRLGIQSTLRPINTTYDSKPYVFYCVRVVTNPSKRAFCDMIRVVGKEDRFKVLRDRLPEVDDRRFPSSLLKPLGKCRVNVEGKNPRYAQAAVLRPSITAESLRHFCDADTSIAAHLDGEVAWDQIESIEYKGEEMTYDLSVPTHHSFVVNDVITHNTTFALNWAYKTAMIYGYNVYYYSLEMPLEQVRRILYVMHSNNPKFRKLGYEPLDYAAIRDGVYKDGTKVSQQDIDFYKLIIDDMEQGFKNRSYGHIFVECPDEVSTTMSMVKNRIEMVHQSTPIHLVFIDYLGLLSAERKLGDHREELNSIFRDAKQLCLTFNRGERIPVVALHQINREGKKEADKNDGVYTTHALADSSAAERTADVISYTYLNDMLRDAQETKIGCIKNRDNPHFKPFLAKIHFESRFISNIMKPTGNFGIGTNTLF